jgi:hypothetical protein
MTLPKAMNWGCSEAEITDAGLPEDFGTPTGPPVAPGITVLVTATRWKPAFAGAVPMPSARQASESRKVPSALEGGTRW